MAVMLNMAVIFVTSIAIFYAGKMFARASSRIGDYFKLPKSVKGATLDAVSSSSPELMIALFSVIAFNKFEVGIGTVVGSAMFNLLFIPAICVFVSREKFALSKEIIHRDGMFYNMSVFALLAALFYSKVWTIIVPIIFLFLYYRYVHYIIKHTRRHWFDKKLTRKEQKYIGTISLKNEVLISIVSLLIIGLTTYFLTDHSISLAEDLGISPIIIAFTVIAVATSLPDGVISVINARKGSPDDAISNVFGSNIFNILVGLSIPLLIYTLINGPIEIMFDQMAMIIGLLGATILVLFFLAESHTLSKKRAFYMLLMFFVFQVYVIFISLR